MNCDTNTQLHHYNEQVVNNSREKYIKLGKRFLITTFISSVILAAICGVDIEYSGQRKKKDTEKFGITIVKNDTIETDEMHPTIYSKAPDGTLLLINLDELIEINHDVLSDGLNQNLLTSIIASEEELKTKNGGIIKAFDDKLNEKYGVERSIFSKSLVGKLLGIFQTGSYGPFQVQREVIDKYKDDPELHNKLCYNIANFKFKNKSDDWEELYIRLGYKNADDMVKDLKHHEIDMYAGGGKVGTTVGVICINQILHEIKNSISNFNSSAGYEQIRSQIEKAEENELLKEAKRIAATNINFRNNLITVYSLSKDDRNVGFSDIVNILCSSAFRNGIASSLWCCDYKKANKNCNYLTMLQLMKLNQYYESNGENDIEITKATGRFGSTITKLVNEIFSKKFNEKEAKKFLDSMDEQEINDLYEKAVDKYIQHLRGLFILGSDKHNPNTWIELNEKQEKFLKGNVNLTFVHKYITIQSFINYIMNNKSINNVRKHKIIGDINSKWANYVENHDSDAYSNIIEIIINHEIFKGITGLTDKDYIDYLKGNLGPTLESTTFFLFKTKFYVPEIQKHLNGTPVGNEQNSIKRFLLARNHENNTEN